ncbi:AP2-like ethylene-responsive transcription factor At1g16060 [Lycium barbarum]|uniref:AP2-like ethylene-responsive transcription factor At1g16060 n=1 Tax=Lycium barbarum TaxID=112863 RepID=UPI00293E9FC1|nr:AP2-like ethylene-responsive transcription factor At1g16060 [Lycium barbarum]
MAKLSQQNQRNNSNNTITNNNANNISGSVVKVKRTRKTVPRDSPPQRSSIYRGVTRHRWTGRYEAHLWDKNCWNESQNKKGRQVYLGAYDDEGTAAHAYDLAALKYWGSETILNFPLSTYEKEIIEMECQSREEYIGSLRRKSSGFSRGVSKYRGVARHHHNGRWEARIGRVFGNKYLYLGTYATQEEAATAYDMAAIEYRGLNAVTNFDLSRYIKWLKPNNNYNNNNKNIDHSTPNVETNMILTPNHSTTILDASISQTRPPSATSALGLLLQSTKFKEMMEMTLAAECPPAPVELSDPEPPQISSFPEDMKTYFDTQEFGNFGHDQGEDMIFNEINSFMQQLLEYEFNA